MNDHVTGERDMLARCARLVAQANAMHPETAGTVALNAMTAMAEARGFGADWLGLHIRTAETEARSMIARQAAGRDKLRGAARRARA